MDVEEERWEEGGVCGKPLCARHTPTQHKATRSVSDTTIRGGTHFVLGSTARRPPLPVTLHLAATQARAAAQRATAAAAAAATRAGPCAVRTLVTRSAAASSWWHSNKGALSRAPAASALSAWDHRVRCTRPPSRMLSNLRIIHPPSSDNPTNLPVLILSVDASRYVFNAPEGTSRAFAQRGAKGIARAYSNIFVPRVGVEECGGLFGMIMMRADGGCKQMTLHGPPVLTHYLTTARPYARRDGIRVEVNEAHAGHDASQRAKGKGKPADVLFQDGNIAVSAVAVWPRGYAAPGRGASGSASKEAEAIDDGRQSKRPRTGETSHQGSLAPTPASRNFLSIMFPNDAQPFREEGFDAEIAAAGPTANDATNEAADRMDKKLRSRIRASSASLEEPPLAPVEDSALAPGQAPVLLYVAQGNPVRGRFDAAKAKALGVPEGVLFSHLTKGQDVQIERPSQWFAWDDKTKNAWRARIKAQAFAQDASRGKKRNKLGKAQQDALDDKTLANAQLDKVKICSTDVVGASTPGAVFAQVYLPSTEYLDDFLTERVQEQFEVGDAHMHAIVHCVDPAVLQDERYKSFMRRFPSTHHILSSRGYVPDKLAYPSAALANLRMSYLDENMFKVPHYSLTPRLDTSLLGLQDLRAQVVGLDTQISLHPAKDPVQVSGNAPDFDWELNAEDAHRMASFQTHVGAKVIDNATRAAQQSAWARFMEIAERIKSDAAQTQPANLNGCHSGLQLTALGTGSALPSKYRNVSGTLVHMPDDAGYILLDCGESTYAQLCRKFGDQTNDVLCRLRLVFLSHIHGDHHMGTSRLLLERRKLRPNDPLIIVSNGFTRRYLEEVNTIQPLGIVDETGQADSGGDVHFIDSEHLDHKHGIETGQMTASGAGSIISPEAAWKASLADEARGILSRRHGAQGTSEDRVRALTHSLERTRVPLRQSALKQQGLLNTALRGCKAFTAEVDHRAARCYGIVLRGPDWSLAYSGDTRPSDNLVSAGRNVDVLIHEATFEETEPEMAHMKGHSTVAQAIDVAQRMGAKRLLLTHFSQRYPKLTRISSAAGDLPVGMAFDLMTMGVDDIGKTSRYREALQLLFDMEGEEDEAASVRDDGQDIEKIPMAVATNDAGAATPASKQHNTQAPAAAPAHTAGAARQMSTSATPLVDDMTLDASPPNDGGDTNGKRVGD